MIVILVFFLSTFVCETCSFALNKYKYHSVKHMHIKHPQTAHVLQISFLVTEYVCVCVCVCE